MKRILAGLAAAIALVILWQAAVWGGQPRVTLTYWCSPYPNEAGWAIMATRMWNQAHPDIKVKLQAIPQGRVAEDILREAIRNRKTPDVCSHLFPADVHEFVAMGGLLPLDSYASLVETARKRSGSRVLDGFRSTDGKLYQVPWKCNPIMLQYNSGLLKKNGLKVPRTYTEFLAVASVLRARGVYAWAPNPANKWFKRYYDFYPLYFAAGSGRPFLDSAGRPAFNNGASLVVFSFLQRCFRDGYSPAEEIYQNDGALNEAFVSNKLAFLVTGPWNIPQIEELAGDSVKFGFAPMPVPDNADLKKPTYTYGNFRNIGVFANTQHRAEAARFAEFLISRQSDLAFLEMCSELPYRQDLFTDPAFAKLLKSDPYLATFAKQLPNVRPVANSPKFNKMLAAISNQFVECSVRGAKNARQAVQDAASEATQIYGR